MFGGDWLYFDPDKSRTRINFEAITKYIDSYSIPFFTIRILPDTLLIMDRTKSGAPFSFYYARIVTIDEAIGKTFAYSPDSKTIPFGNLSGCNMHRLL